MEKRYVDGLFFNQKRDNAPDFVLGSLSIKTDAFAAWLLNETPNDHGYINLDILMGKSGKPYMVVNEFKKASKSTSTEVRGDDGEVVPF